MRLRSGSLSLFINLAVFSACFSATPGPDERAAGGEVPAISAAGAARELPDKRYTQQEQDAIQVVKDWVAAWETGDPTRVTSYMADDVQFRLDPSQPLLHGRDRLTKVIGSFIAAIESMKAPRLYAIGGETGTIVLAERVDRFVGYAPLVQAASVFRVKNGKIEEWYDVPLPKDRPPPPPGATINGH